jgi:hypothetical protein
LVLYNCEKPLTISIPNKNSRKGAEAQRKGIGASPSIVPSFAALREVIRAALALENPI